MEEEEVVIKILVEGGVDNARYILTSCGPRLSVKVRGVVDIQFCMIKLVIVWS